MRKLKIFLSIVAVLIFSTVLIFAADVTVDNILNKLSQSQQQINTMRMTMNSKTTIAMEGRDPMSIAQRSTMIFKKPDKMKMETFSPMHQVIIRSGNKVYMKMPDGKIIKQDMAEYGMQLPGMDFTPGTMQDFNKNFTATLENSESRPAENLYVINLIPKQPNEMLSKMKMTVDYARGCVNKIQMFNNKGEIWSSVEFENQLTDGIWMPKKLIVDSNMPRGKSKTEIIYEEIKINGDISNDEFKF